jgi:hypothetical protein
MTHISKLHRDQRGSLSPMILTLTIVLVYMIVWILNTGQTIYDKQRTQDTADAVALVHADWTARSLNIMAMNNVAASQALVVGATSAALEMTALDLAKRSGQILLKLKDYTTDWGWGPPSLVPPMPPMPYCPYYQAIVIDFGIIHKACVAFQLFRGTMALAAEGYVVYVHTYYDPLSIASKSGQIIDAMNALNDDLVERLPERIAVNAQTLITLNKVDHVVFHPPCKDAASCDASQEGQGTDLPVQRHISFADPFAYKEMCIAADHGTSAYPAPTTGFTPNMRGAYEKRGFPVGKGPLTAGGKGDKSHIRDHVNDESGMASWLPTWQTFYDAFGPAYYTRSPSRT